MTWSAVLNVTLGITVLYLAFSVAVSRINEFVTSRLQLRARGVERALYTMLGGDKPPEPSIGAAKDGQPIDLTDAPAPGIEQLTAQAVKNHPAIATLEASLGKKRRISYLPSRAFSAAVLDILAPPTDLLLESVPEQGLTDAARQALDRLRAQPDAQHVAELEALLPEDDPLRTTTLPLLKEAMSADVVARARERVLALPPTSPARRPLLRMLTDAGDDRDRFRAKLEHWYDDQMSRLTGWYKRYVQKFIVAYGIALTLLFNVDTISIAQALWRSPVEQAAAAQAAASAAGKAVGDVDTSVSAIKGLSMPIGWTASHQGNTVSQDPRHFPVSTGGWLTKVLGLAITALALSFGAPFWFDVLGKLARLRNAGGVDSSTEDTKRR